MKAQSQEWKAKVRKNQALGDGYGLLRLHLPKAFPRVHAGAFCMLATSLSREVLLRRPMAFFDAKKEASGTKVEILYRVVGRGTRHLAQIVPGAELSLLGPIGNFFSQPRRNEQFVVVAGGIGISPFYLWGRELTPAQKKRVRVLFGFPTEEQAKLAKMFHSVGLRPLAAVEKARTSFQGTVVDLLRRELSQHPATRILTCGPEPMMEAVKGLAQENSLPCELSMEARMACGMGVCLSCVTSCAREGSGDYALVCQDGPVFTFMP